MPSDYSDIDYDWYRKNTAGDYIAPDTADYEDDRGDYGLFGGGDGSGTSLWGRHSDHSGDDWGNTGSTAPAPPVLVPDNHRHGRNPVADKSPVTDTSAMFPNRGRAQSMLGNDSPAAAGNPVGDLLDLPLNAGPGKYSRQNVRSRAMMLPAVRQAISDGRQVMLVCNITVNRQPVRGIEVLSRGLSDDNPMYVTFSGDFNADGSQARGRHARMENSDECDCSTGGGSGSGGSGGGGGTGGGAGGSGGGTGGGPSGSGGGGGGTGGGPSGGSTPGTGAGGEAADGSTPETGSTPPAVTDREPVTDKEAVTQKPYDWDSSSGSSGGGSPAPVQTYNPTPTYAPETKYGGELPEVVVKPEMPVSVFNKEKNKDKYHVSEPIANFLEGALSIPVDISLNTTWKPSTLTPDGADAITVGETVRFTPEDLGKLDVAFWVPLIAHEHTHRVDYENQGNGSFIYQYGNHFLKDWLGGGMSKDEAYGNIPAEKKAYANQRIIDEFFDDKKNKKDFTEILNSKDLSKQEKSDQLKALALERIKLLQLMREKKEAEKILKRERDSKLMYINRPKTPMETIMENHLEDIENRIRIIKYSIQNLRYKLWPR